jgi:hypothetical protein
MDVKSVLEMNITSEENAIAYAERLNLTTYLNNGCVIGNLKSSDGSHCAKFHRILETARGARAVFYSQFTAKGSTLFAEFLTENKCSFLFLRDGAPKDEKLDILEMFRAARGQCFLILHASYTEGISVLGAQQLHILEPIPILAKKLQLVARVVRYKSHDHLPREDRVVRVYQWGCTLKSLDAQIQKFLRSIHMWWKLKTPMFYTTHYNVFDQNLTPDSIIFRNENAAANAEVATIGLLRAVAHREPDCCIEFPSEEQGAHCRATRKACIPEKK